MKQEGGGEKEGEEKQKGGEEDNNRDKNLDKKNHAYNDETKTT